MVHLAVMRVTGRGVSHGDSKCVHVLRVESTQVNEARDAFDVFDSADGLLAFENVGKVLDKLGFDEVRPSFLLLLQRFEGQRTPEFSTDSIALIARKYGNRDFDPLAFFLSRRRP